MRLKEIGKTGELLPDVGFGTAAYKGGALPLSLALQMGAVIIDTAEIYGSEATVGRAIKGMREGAFIITKVATNHCRRLDMIAACDRSLEALGIDRIDLYLLHGPPTNCSIADAIGTMEDLVDAGKIRFIGVSNFYMEDLKAAQRALTRHKIVANEMPYSLVERTIEMSGLIKYCRNQGISISAYSPLYGVIKAMMKADINMNIYDIAKTVRRSALQVALAWCLRHDHVFAIPKASKFHHIEECVDASGTRLSEAQVDALNKCVKFKIRTALELRLRRWVRGALRAIHEPMK